MNEGFGKDFYRKGNSVKRFGPFSEPLDSQNWKAAVLIPFPKGKNQLSIRSIFRCKTRDETSKNSGTFRSWPCLTSLYRKVFRNRHWWARIGRSPDLKPRLPTFKQGWCKWACMEFSLFSLLLLFFLPFPLFFSIFLPSLAQTCWEGKICLVQVVWIFVWSRSDRDF